jgi:hypothetical protein
MPITVTLFGTRPETIKMAPAESFRQFTKVSLTAPEAATRAADVIVLLVDQQQLRDIATLFDLSNVKVMDTRGQWE